jgi:hypothetical protein
MPTAIFKYFTKRVQFSLGLATVALLSASASAQVAPNQQLIFTEYSDTLLTATVGGNPVGVVQNLGPDDWQWGIPISPAPTFELGNRLFFYWAEPEGPAEVNGIIDLRFFPVENQLYGGMRLGSDLDPSAFQLSPQDIAENGAFGFTLTIASGLGTSVFDIYFNDLSDSTNVPDTSSTGSLLLISAVSILALAKNRRVALDH